MNTALQVILESLHCTYLTLQYCANITNTPHPNLLTHWALSSFFGCSFSYSYAPLP